jgi:hypothetical protein
MKPHDYEPNDIHRFVIIIANQNRRMGIAKSHDHGTAHPLSLQ